jgi:probable H4MPT-linked C1 transfer pathway protein
VSILGWDVGGVNTKVARVEDGRVRVARGRPFELQRSPQALVPLLRELADECRSGPPAPTVHAVTMTAELSQLFRTKREGVAFVLDALAAAFPSESMRVFTVDGRFVDPDEARARPLAVAAANWTATATYVSRRHPDALLIDIGTTTTDIIPIAGGAVVAKGRTDPDRLASGELVYTGALRTPVEAIASHVPLGGERINVAAEGFALAGDVHVWRGDLAPADYTVPAPDGRPATREFAGERLARAICADREMLDDAGVSAIAGALAAAQVDRIAVEMQRVSARHPSIRTAVVTGLGAFLGRAAACQAGLRVVPLSDDLGRDAAQFAPAAAVALLLESSHRPPIAGHQSPVTSPQSVLSRPAGVGVVVKVGGGLLAGAHDLDKVLDAIREAARRHRLLIVPGGGPFADAVRALDRQSHLSDDAAHWMAVLAMDQYAHMLADRLQGSALIVDQRGVREAIDAGRIPILAPSRWLREADPLPHSWDVTSDSVAAWVAGALGAPRLVLIKPAGASGAGLVDAYFSRALPAPVSSEIVTADRVDALASMLSGG